MEYVQDVGAYAGIAAFIGLAVLALLYFAQARDVRRLRENAEFLVEGDPMPITEAPEGEDETAVAPASRTPEAAARAAAASAPNEAEAFRRAELARQAAERRQRFEQRRRPGSGARDRIPETLRSPVVLVGALILLAGIAFGATQILGGDDEPAGGGGGQKANLACPPGQTKVAVLNGTAEPGLAGSFAPQLRQAGYDVNKVSNTSTPFETSTLMFDQAGEQCVGEIGPVVGIKASEPMDQDVRADAEGAQVAVILGEDVASGSSGDSAGDAAATGAE